MKKPITPDEFTAKVKAIIDTSDSEIYYNEPEIHEGTDTLMEDLLTSLGYTEGVKLIRAETRWYE